ncbi:MAG: DUF2178 domain-containing protein [Sedimentisphaerales bacterium]|nr:DUF2178 domain-containing protein [Sedimentisphaerales bacterium]
MTRYQKIAWFSLAISATAVIAGSTAIAIELHIRGYSTIGWWFFVVPLASLQLTPHLFKKPLSPAGVATDERDLMIDSKASRIALGASYFFFIAACATLWVSVGIDTPIPAYWLGRIILGGWLTAAIVHALTITICYAWAGKGE